MANDRNGRDLDRGTQLILGELRDLRVEMREDRRRSDEERRKELRRSDERFANLLREFREDSARRETAMLMAMNKGFTTLRRDVRTVGLAIVRTLDRNTKILAYNTGLLERNTRILERNTRILERHTGILERMDRKLGARDNGRPGPNGGRAR